MQQTTTYKLNLIEKSDKFSPDALNQNMEKVEEALTGEARARQAADTALSNRVTALEAKKILYGTFTGGGTEGVIDLGVTPLAVFVKGLQPHGNDCLVLSKAVGGAGISGNKSMEIVPNGFRVTSSLDPSHYNQMYSFIAIA